MRTFLKIVAGLFVLGLLGLGAGVFLTSGERDIARDFVTNVSTGQYDAARAAMHQELAKQFPEGALASAVEGVQPYTEISFSGFETSGGVTKLDGTASTETGCSSKISFELVNDQITGFSIEPLCRD